MNKRLFVMATCAAVLMGASVYAMDLHQARASGLIGEKNDGYVTALQSTPEITGLVDTVNAKRQQEYARISGQNGQPVDVVAKLAAQQIVNTIDSGTHYQAADGSWKIK